MNELFEQHSVQDRCFCDARTDCLSNDRVRLVQTSSEQIREQKSARTRERKRQKRRERENERVIIYSIRDRSTCRSIVFTLKG